ncbi:MAG: hypothetical protein CMD16_03100 [Flavobacteriales bacterium]|nr:hypothetical protein [Flavobacteriales bacterium]|tara:strand:+ start:4768 stop:5799 length:1032 start_codon:yes stop_codon:yes gene_type:complete
MKKYLFLISIFFLSCQEEITLELPRGDDKLVVQGTIENGFPPYVVLTKNQGYFDPINSNTYNNFFVDNVDEIKIWYTDEEGIIIESKDLELFDTDLSELIIGQPLPIYTVTDLDSSNINDYEFSKAGREYFLEIKWNNEIITAQTTIPNPTPLDCLWVEQSETAENDWKCDIRAIYSDPINEQNNILIKSKRIQHYNFNADSCLTRNKADLQLQLIDAGSDVLINGESFETYFPRPSENGFPTGKYNSKHEKECDDGNILERKEDIVLIKFCQIDEPSMKFWRGVVRQAGTNGNPFAEPMNLSSNINGGLGAFTGYGSVYYKVPIIKDTTIINTIKPNILDIF